MEGSGGIGQTQLFQTLGAEAIGFEFLFFHHGRQKAVVGGDKGVAIVDDHDDLPLGAHARVDHSHMHRAAREVAVGTFQPEAGFGWPMDFDFVGEVDDFGFGVPGVHHPLHGADEGAFVAEIGGEGDHAGRGKLGGIAHVVPALAWLKSRGLGRLAARGKSWSALPMAILDLSGKNAFVTGVADDVGFAWHISKALQAAGAKVYLACHPRVLGIVQRFLERDKYAESRKLPYGAEGDLKPIALFGCDVEFDTAADIPEDRKGAKGYRDTDASIEGAMKAFNEASGGEKMDILIHSVAFSPEIQNTHLQTSRQAYLTAMSVSSYSLVALTKAALPIMADDASVIGLSYGASQRTTPGYGGGMASAKAALECDARLLAFFAGEQGVRVNIVSPGAYASRAARSVGAINDMIDESAQRSPLRRAITPEDVANTTLFLCSPLASAITGEVIYVDCGFNTMSAI